MSVVCEPLLPVLVPPVVVPSPVLVPVPAVSVKPVSVCVALAFVVPVVSGVLVLRLLPLEQPAAANETAANNKALIINNHLQDSSKLPATLAGSLELRKPCGRTNCAKAYSLGGAAVYCR